MADGGHEAQAPQVDFEKEMVVALFRGSRPTSGYGVWIERVLHWRGQRAVVVLYGERDPDSEFAGGTQTPSHAGCVAVLPRVENVNVRFINVASEAGKKLLGESEPLLQKRP